MLNEVNMVLGDVSVVTTQNTGLSPEYWAERASHRIISVGGQCHPLIKDQADAFKRDIEKVIAYHVREAIKSDRTTLIAEFERQGHKDMADIIRKLTT